MAHLFQRARRLHRAADTAFHLPKTGFRDFLVRRHTVPKLLLPHTELGHVALAGLVRDQRVDLRRGAHGGADH